ncbi:MAG TPA: sigma-70 family RNA polymerase sigma factor [Bacteroidales bacterium]|nr:sigma-70 family RNA polymerase sigma factor [Bacteroidales bacterium]HQI70506.1 sigma-70 family RNA polymerase sigma factor [Bacteroidales bacterium]
MEIKELINGCRKWHKKAQNELYDKYAPKLYAVSLRYVADSDLARDVLQEALIKIYKNIGTFSLTDDKAFYCWMHRITVNTALNHLRKNLKNKFNTEIQNFENEIPNDTFEESFSVYDEIIACIGSRTLFTMVGELPDGYRTVFNLYVVEGFSHKEIAAQLDITINTSKTQLFKARKMLMSKINGIVKNNTLKEVV